VASSVPDFQLLVPDRYIEIPWKNGEGVTRDIFLFPEGSGHDSFDVRISLAPITRNGPFSSFPGIERTITRLSTNSLALVFDDGRTVPLARLEPVTFDSVLAPHSVLGEGSAEVINIMTRRGRWSAHVRVLSGPFEDNPAPPDGSLVLVYAVKGSWLATGPAARADIGPNETLLARNTAGFHLRGDAGAEALFAILTPAAG